MAVNSRTIVPLKNYKAAMNARPYSCIACGGTLACVCNENGVREPRLKGCEILKKCGVDDRDVDVRDPFTLDSTEMTSRDVGRLAREISDMHKRHAGKVGQVITMGTDSMVETACKIGRLCANAVSRVPVVFTGSMGICTDPDWDGPANLKLAVLSAKYAGPGVYIAFHDRLIAATHCIKRQPVAPYSFDAIGDGLIGEFDSCRGVLVMTRRIQSSFSSWDAKVRKMPSPGTIAMFEFSHEARADQLDRLASRQVEAVILKAFGDGNIPIAGKRGRAFMNVVREMISRNILVAMVSKCPYGRVQCAYVGGDAYRRVGVLSGLDTTEATVARLGAILAITSDPAERYRLWFTGVPGDTKIEFLASPLRVSASAKNGHNGSVRSPLFNGA